MVSKAGNFSLFYNGIQNPPSRCLRHDQGFPNQSISGRKTRSIGAHCTFKQHALRAHNQTIIWKSALLQDPPQLERAEFGWVKDSSYEFVQARSQN